MSRPNNLHYVHSISQTVDVERRKRGLNSKNCHQSGELAFRSDWAVVTEQISSHHDESQYISKENIGRITFCREMHQLHFFGMV